MTDNVTSVDQSTFGVNSGELRNHSSETVAAEQDCLKLPNDDCCHDNSEPITPNDSQVTAVMPPAAEPCPTPLVWQEILETFHTQAQPFQVRTGGRRIAGRVWGDGPPVYFLNGFVATAEMAALTMWLMREDYQCVVFDSIEYSDAKGRDSEAEAVPSIRDFSEDVVAVADHLGHQMFHVFGSSFGGAVALQLALNVPERIGGIAIQHGFASRPLSMFERMLARWFQRSRKTLDSLPIRRGIQQFNHRRWFPPFDGTRFQFLLDSTGTIPLAELSRKALALHRFDVSSRLAEIRQSVLLIRTEGEGKIEADSYEVLAKGLRVSKTEWMHSSGMHPLLTHPHRIAKLLKTAFATSLA